MDLDEVDGINWPDVFEAGGVGACCYQVLVGVNGLDVVGHLLVPGYNVGACT